MEVSYPIAIVGAGGIVRDAHLPAYRLAGFEVAVLTDKDLGKAKRLAGDFSVQAVASTIREIVNTYGKEIIYDIALPATEIPEVIRELPVGATVLIQKPLGENLVQANSIVESLRESRMLAGVNFQLRFAPFVKKARELVNSGALGVLTDIEVYVNVHTPWTLWEFLFSSPRTEMLYHSVHYIDLIRAFLGNPHSITARTYKHPAAEKLSSVRSNILMDYGDYLRAAIHTNHNHDFGLEEQDAYIKIEGTEGVVKMGLGALVNYPEGGRDYFKYIISGKMKALENGRKRR